MLAEPRGIALGDGRLAIADPALDQVFRLGLAGDAGQAAAAGALQQPEAVAWLPDGDLLVADTWNHRVLRVGGGPGTAPAELPPPPGGWYGPRGLALGPEGRLAVTDTGNKRLVVYEPDLTAVRVVAEGLDEPVGVAWTDSGHVLVCATGARRLALVDIGSGAAAWVELPAAWPNYYSRPQVVALGPERWLASDTPQQALWLVDRGAVARLDLAEWQIAPTGLAWDPVGQTLVVGGPRRQAVGTGGGEDE